MNNNIGQIAKQAMQDLLEKMGITIVVNIDDIYQKSVDSVVMYSIVSECIQNGTQDTISPYFPSINLNTPPQRLRSEINKFWEQTQEHQRQELLNNLSQIVDIQWLKDYGLAQRLRSRFPRRIELKTLSPDDWETQHTDILAAASPTSRVLCLFDQDLSNAEGYDSTGPMSGIGLLKNTLSETNRDAVICGILTHTISSIDQEIVRWRELENEWGISLADFLPLAKIRLSDETDEMAFIDGIKKTILNLFCEQIKVEGEKIFEEATGEALIALKNIAVYDFDHMVMIASSNEGVREVDTLFRIFQILQKDSVRKLIVSESISDKFNSLVNASRPISNIKTTEILLAGASRIREQELYEDSSVVKNTPLEVGDIIYNQHKNMDFILLAQPCDLMIRSNGSRGMNNLTVPLVPITESISADEINAKQSNYWRTHSILPYYGAEMDTYGILNFKESYWLSIDVLDIIVCNPDDNAFIDLATDIDIPIQLPIGWQIHLSKLLQDFKLIADELDMFSNSLNKINEPEIQKQLKARIMPKVTLSSEHSPEIPYSNRVFDFKLKRTKRYRLPGASQLLTSFSQYLSREAEEVDFAK